MNIYVYISIIYKGVVIVYHADFIEWSNMLS